MDTQIINIVSGFFALGMPIVVVVCVALANIPRPIWRIEYNGRSYRVCQQSRLGSWRVVCYACPSEQAARERIERAIAEWNEDHAKFKVVDGPY